MRFFSNFPSFHHNVILLALMFKSWYKANAVWYKLLMKKGIKFLKIKKIRRKRRRGEEEEEEEEEEEAIRATGLLRATFGVIESFYDH